MVLDWYCTVVFGMRQQSCWGSMVFQEATSEPMKRQRKHVIWRLTTNTWTNRAGIVSSVITCSVNQFICIHCKFCYCLSVVRFSSHSILFCFVRFALFDYSVFDHHSFTQCIFFPDIGTVFQVFWSPYQQPSGKSINIIYQCHLLS